MNKIRIKFRGIKPGKYNYQFKVDDHFFSTFEASQINAGEVCIDTEMIVTKDLLTFNFNIKGKVSVQCDRCLDSFLQNISNKSVLYVEFGNENSDLSDADNKIILSNKENEIVLDKHLYDYIHLSLPYQKVHPKDKKGNSLCNMEMIKKLEDINSIKKQETDPRWDKLKNLYN